MIAGVAGDPDATRTVYAVVIGLAVLGVALLVVAIWLFRQTKVDPELLAPLERMDDRRWTSRDPATQRRMLDEVRPDGAEPLHRERPIPALDAEFEAEVHPVGFDDLQDAKVVLQGIDLAERAPDADVSVDDDGAEAEGPTDAGSDDDHGDQGTDAGVEVDDEAASSLGGDGDADDAVDETDEPGDDDDEAAAEVDDDDAAGTDVAEDADDAVVEPDEPGEPADADGAVPETGEPDDAHDHGVAETDEAGDDADVAAAETDGDEATGTDVAEDADAVDITAGEDDLDGRRSAVSSAQD